MPQYKSNRPPLRYTMVNDEKHTTIDHQNHEKTPPYATRNVHRTIATAIVAILVVVGLTALILWLLYHPHNPKFTLVAAAVYGNTSPPTITAMQVTLLTRNPNNRVSISYDRLVAFLSYGDRPITPRLMLPPLHHAKDSTVAMSPIWPVSPAVVNGLVADEVGTVSLRVVLTGNLRWKAGNVWRSGRKRVYVGCDVLVGLKRGVLGQVPLVRSSVCRVDI